MLSIKRTRAIPLRLRHLPCPYCRRRRARSRTPLPLAIVSIEVISPTIAKSIPAHASKQQARVQMGSRTLGVRCGKQRERRRSGRCLPSPACLCSVGDRAGPSTPLVFLIPALWCETITRRDQSDSPRECVNGYANVESSLTRACADDSALRPPAHAPQYMVLNLSGLTPFVPYGT